MTNTFRPAPSIENMDGIACAAIADFDLCEPFKFVGSEIQAEDLSQFYSIAVFSGGTPITGNGADAQRYMLVSAEDRGMVLEKPCNEMIVCRDRS
jgi:hypothetical protein